MEKFLLVKVRQMNFTKEVILREDSNSSVSQETQQWELQRGVQSGVWH